MTAIPPRNGRTCRTCRTRLESLSFSRTPRVRASRSCRTQGVRLVRQARHRLPKVAQKKSRCINRVRHVRHVRHKSRRKSLAQRWRTCSMRLLTGSKSARRYASMRGTNLVRSPKPRRSPRRRDWPGCRHRSFVVIGPRIRMPGLFWNTCAPMVPCARVLSAAHSVGTSHGHGKRKRASGRLDCCSSIPADGPVSKGRATLSPAAGGTDP